MLREETETLSPRPSSAEPGRIKSQWLSKPRQSSLDPVAQSWAGQQQPELVGSGTMTGDHCPGTVQGTVSRSRLSLGHSGAPAIPTRMGQRAQPRGHSSLEAPKYLLLLPATLIQAGRGRKAYRQPGGGLAWEGPGGHGARQGWWSPMRTQSTVQLEGVHCSSPPCPHYPPPPKAPPGLEPETGAGRLLLALATSPDPRAAQAPSSCDTAGGSAETEAKWNRAQTAPHHRCRHARPPTWPPCRDRGLSNRTPGGHRKGPEPSIHVAPSQRRRSMRTPLRKEETRGVKLTMMKRIQEVWGRGEGEGGREASTKRFRRPTGKEHDW